MKELYTEIQIQARAEVVWGHLTRFAAYPEWNPFVAEAIGTVEEGAVLKIRLTPPSGKAMTFKPTLTRVQPPYHLRWQGRLLVPYLFDGEHIFEIEPLEEGGVRLIHRETFRGLLVPFLWRRLDTDTRAGFEAMNVALKVRAEAQTP